MSDEAHIEAAHRHRDLTAPSPWQCLQPDEAAMAAEEGVSSRDVLPDLQESFLCYCFADTAAEEWRTVATRAHALMAMCFPHLFNGRSQHEIRDIRAGARWVAGFPLADMVREMMPHRDLFSKVLLYYFPEHREWLRHGCQNLFLIARSYQQGLVTKWDGKEMTFERLAEVFEEIPQEMAGEARETAMKRARSRWSARAQTLIVKPIERVGGSAGSVLGKSETMRQRCSQAQRGNQNRRGM